MGVWLYQCSCVRQGQAHTQSDTGSSNLHWCWHRCVDRPLDFHTLPLLQGERERERVCARESVSDKSGVMCEDSDAKR